MGYRINERNTGAYSLAGERKQRRVKKEKINDSDMELMKRILWKVQQSIEYNKELSIEKGETGHLNPNAVFSMSETLLLTGKEFDQLSSIVFDKLECDYE
mgnify:FL=1